MICTAGDGISGEKIPKFGIRESIEGGGSNASFRGKVLSLRNRRIALRELGEEGATVQNDSETDADGPYIPCGVADLCPVAYPG